MTIGKYSHAEGYSTIAVWDAHSEGYMTSAFGQRSHAEGSYTLTRGSSSLACGIKAKALGDWSFAYNGNSNLDYSVSGTGEFGINPVGGVWGFYVGKDPLQKIINDSIPDTSRIEKALSAPGYEYFNVPFEVIQDMHINSDPSNSARIGTPIAAKTSAYVCQYCGIGVKPGDEYEISTRLGGNTCIMLFEKPFIPLSSYEGYMIKGNAIYKKYEMHIPESCYFMTVDAYTNLTGG